MPLSELSFSGNSASNAALTAALEMPKPNASEKAAAACAIALSGVLSPAAVRLALDLLNAPAARAATGALTASASGWPLACMVCTKFSISGWSVATPATRIGPAASSAFRINSVHHLRIAAFILGMSGVHSAASSASVAFQRSTMSEYQLLAGAAIALYLPQG